jgi:inositol hexakisphosphate/diphosphoinositol-pentakisphosphate kinase
MQRLANPIFSVKLPKSFVAIDLSEKVPEAFERSTNGKGKEHNMTESEERGRTEERGEIASLLPIANEKGEVVSPRGIVSTERSGLKEISPSSLPPPMLDDNKE